MLFTGSTNEKRVEIMADSTVAAVASTIASLIFMCVLIFCIYRCCTRRAPHTVIYNNYAPIQPPETEPDKAPKSVFYDGDLAKRLL